MAEAGTAVIMPIKSQADDKLLKTVGSVQAQSGSNLVSGSVFVCARVCVCALRKCYHGTFVCTLLDGILNIGCLAAPEWIKQ